MTQDEYARKLDELDSLLNDPDVPMDPARVWALLADLSGKDIGMSRGRAGKDINMSRGRAANSGAALAGMATAAGD